MPWRTTNITLMDPNALAAQLDDNTERLFGGRKGRKINPYPRMKVQEKRTPSAPRRREKIAPSPVPVSDGPAIQPRHVYVVEVLCGDEEDVARQVLRKCPEARLLRPEFHDAPAYPGYLLLAFDHPISPDEQTRLCIKNTCRLLDEVAADERQRILALCSHQLKEGSPWI